MRKRGKGSEYQAVDKGEIALNQYGHEQLPADVTPQRAFEKDWTGNKFAVSLSKLVDALSNDLYKY